MKPLQKLWFLLLVVLFFVIQSKAESNGSESKEAYVTLLYGDDYTLGVRVLGKSIRNTGSIKDMVVLASEGVSDFAVELLQADGWIVEKISLLANPNQSHRKNLWGVYTKLKIFNMTTYKKVVYLDADTLVVKNIEELFKCEKFCANLKHSETMNSGVVVLEPSQAVFNDMMSKISTLHSETGCEQGFLVSYYSDFPNAHLFEPNLSSKALKSRQSPKMERLSFLYNADVGLFVMNNKWVSLKDEFRILHYNIGPFKPWEWYASWLFKPVDLWQSVREQLPESLPGTGGGRNPNEELLVNALFILPFCFLFFCFYFSFKTGECSSTLFRAPFTKQFRHFFSISTSTTTSKSNHQATGFIIGLFDNLAQGVSIVLQLSSYAFQVSNSADKVLVSSQAKIPIFLGWLSIFVSYMAALISLRIALSIVPQQVTPWTGFLLAYEWTCIIFFFFFGGFLHLVYLWGKRAAFYNVGSFSTEMDCVGYDSGKGHQRTTPSCEFATWFYGLGLAILAAIAPSLPCVFGKFALFPRILLLVVGCIILATFMTYAADHLAIRFFSKGFDEGDKTKPRSLNDA